MSTQDDVRLMKQFEEIYQSGTTDAPSLAARLGLTRKRLNKLHQRIAMNKLPMASERPKASAISKLVYDEKSGLAIPKERMEEFLWEIGLANNTKLTPKARVNTKLKQIEIRFL